jgi:hypothetical protein
MPIHHIACPAKYINLDLFQPLHLIRSLTPNIIYTPIPPVISNNPFLPGSPSIYSAAITAPNKTNSDPPTLTSTPTAAAFPLVVGTLAVLALVLLELVPVVELVLVPVELVVDPVFELELPVLVVLAEPVDDVVEPVPEDVEGWVEAETVFVESMVN